MHVWERRASAPGGDRRRRTGRIRCRGRQIQGREACIWPAGLPPPRRRTDHREPSTHGGLATRLGEGLTAAIVGSRAGFPAVPSGSGEGMGRVRTAGWRRWLGRTPLESLQLVECLLPSSFFICCCYFRRSQTCLTFCQVWMRADHETCITLTIYIKKKI